MTVRIRVTRQVIGRSMRGHPTWNPVALAMTSAGLHDAEATEATMRWGRAGHRCTVATPGHIAAYITLHTMGGQVHPFEMELEDR